MASGPPVITTSANGVSETIDHRENGLVVEDVESVPEIAAAARYLTNPGRREEIGAAARKTAESFTEERNLDEIEQIYQEALERKRSGP